jgi:hypothetical protein
VQANNQTNESAGKGSTRKPRFTGDTPLNGDDIMAILYEAGKPKRFFCCVDGQVREFAIK